MMPLDIWSRTRNPTPTPSVVRNPTPPKNLRLRLRNPVTIKYHVKWIKSWKQRQNARKV